ncbi:Protein CBG06815 [Caenorhabditis briggsae]|uniref:Uncharacterized protein n=2 Tax=Caenorhabditis briggsae TaxID=6238 RepID=A0AAE9EP09_CAEBR|nr:Protein CBG06815 [Caenorhabditis briggsae]ULU02361.1 hypothetical protein L3Y34_002140 [Caenorhabditis briggsae]UMM24982.1 hypothetical protein L5515_004968 [Caenorhabditis briggsae]CAP27061.1 Protein CBG06815 [Caenorhabditis briggsae]
MRILLFLLFLPTVFCQFHLFIVISCESYCHVTFRHHEMEYYSVMEHTAQIARHFEDPVPQVLFQIDNFYNTTDFMPVTTKITWTSYLNKTFYYNQDGAMIVAHYFCPEGRCLIDNTRIEYKRSIEQWCLGLVLIGLMFFMVISGAAEAIYKWTKQKIFRRRSNTPQPYNSLELTDMSKRAVTLTTA